MASKEGSSYDWILGEDADEDLEPWQRVLKENAKNAKVERFLELLRGILGPDELLNLAGMVRDMDVRHVQKLYMKQWQEHAMASAHGGADPAAMMMGHPPADDAPGLRPTRVPSTFDWRVSTAAPASPSVRLAAR